MSRNKRGEKYGLKAHQYFSFYNLSLNACVNNCSSYQIYHKDVQMSGFTFIIKTDIDSHKSGLSNSGGENSGM